MTSSPNGSDDGGNNVVVHTSDTESEAIDGVEIGHRSRAQATEISRIGVLSYAIGHFYNDLCASMWFTYLLIFMEKIILMLSWEAGLLMFIGQVTDAICTPLVGLLSDASLLPGFLKRFGRRKSWHIIGTFCVTISFPLIFGNCLVCGLLSPTSPFAPAIRILYYVPFIMMFQFGWAAVQISHLSMIPELTTKEATRMSMTSLRYGFTVVANLFVFTCLFLFLSTTTSGGHSKVISPADLPGFRALGLITMFLGLITSSLFYAGTKEPRAQRRISRLQSISSQQSSISSSTRDIIKMTWKDWLAQRQFYQVAILYLCSRVFINISQVYFGFYIIQTQGREKKHVALLPLTAFIASFIVSCILGVSSINAHIRKGKSLFISGAVIGLLNSVALFFPLPFPDVSLFFVAAILGLIQAILLISSLNLTNVLINLNTESGAFVFGAMSFLDKISNGLIIQIVELLNPSKNCSPATLFVEFLTTKSFNAPHNAACGNFYRNIMSFIPGTCAFIILVVLIWLDLPSLSVRRQRGTDDRRELVPRSANSD